MAGQHLKAFITTHVSATPTACEKKTVKISPRVVAPSKVLGQEVSALFERRALECGCGQEKRDGMESFGAFGHQKFVNDCFKFGSA